MARNKFFQIPKEKEEPTVQEDPNAHFKNKYLLAHFENVNHLEKNLKRLPAVEEFFFLQTWNSFNAFTFIPFVAKNLKVRSLFASTYSISRRVITALIELHTAGMIDEITLLISDSMIKRNPTTIDMLLSVAAAHANLKVLFGWNHSKVCLLRTNDDHFIIEGSGNWAENAQMEQYTFANSKGLFDFRMELFAPEKARHFAENGSLRAVSPLAPEGGINV
ncbi:hypothetical protein J0871_16910 [Salegentibacter sp. BDJ18]|uniref:hypothetical protein n=1 Tax=Salegentibacter sp. BDJ18 TaxID=2816376 RepID=UPI001AAF7839|nr:hypothetical protein [Salegentibacter sp. BDJ18]MBO2546099.1 hypothetical protein [Salegentibacter sp. BDJ18]